MRAAVRLVWLWVSVAGMAASEASAQQIPVRIGGSPSSFVGVPFDLPIEVDLSGRSDKLGSFRLTLRWNPAVLQFLGGSAGNFGALVVNGDSASAGLLKLTGANPGGVGGRVVLGVGRFVPVANAPDTLRLSVAELYAAGSFGDLLPSAVWADRAYCPAVGRFGDLDGDQAANSRDALLALSAAIGLTVPGNPAMGDVDGDGLTGARDALIILSYAVGLDVSGFRVLVVAPGACAMPRRPLLALLPGPVTFDLGQQAKFTAVTSDSTGAGIAVTDVFWSSSNDAVATVSPVGVVSAVGLGTATITVRRQGGASASATVTVVRRRTHWVDAFASPDQDNQLGAPELPFRTIPQALAYARAGDTVRVRPGRYDEALLIDRPVVLMGDTSGGKGRPVLAGRGSDGPGVVIPTPGRVELHALVLDTLAQGAVVLGVDTLLVRGVEFRAPPRAYLPSLFVSGAGAVYVQRSSFFGPAAGPLYANHAISVGGTALVALDSSYIADYGADGVNLAGVDSLWVHATTIQYNHGYGIWASESSGGYAPPPGSSPAARVARGGVLAGPSTMGAALSANRLAQNASGAVWLHGVRGVRFDHNWIASGAYAVQLFGADSTVEVSFLGDSIRVADYGNALYLANYRRATLDSTVALGPRGLVLLGGRWVTVRNSRFLGITSTALELSPPASDSTRLSLRNAEFGGPPKGQCDQCATMVYGDRLSVDADSVAMSNMSFGFALSNSRAALRRVQLNDYFQGFYTDCGLLQVSAGTFSDGSGGVEVDGCGAADSLVVQNSSFARHSSAAVFGYGVRTMVDSSQFTDDQYGVDARNGPARIQGNRVVRPKYAGIYHYWFSPAAGTTRIAGNSVSCDVLGGASATGIMVEHASSAAEDSVAVEGNTIADCYRGAWVAGARRVSVRGNRVDLPASSPGGDRGIYAQALGTVVVASDTVSGLGQSGAIWALNSPVAVVDSNLVSGGLGAGLYLPGPFDSLRVRDNVITEIRPGGSLPSRGAIVVSSGTLGSSYAAELRRNRISRSVHGLVLARSSPDTLTIRVDSNTVRAADSIGVLVTAYSYAVLRYNAIDSAGLDAVRLANSYVARPAAVIGSNNFTRSGHFGVRNLTGYTIDATGNWWNDANGPACAPPVACDATSRGDSVSINVSFSPWATAPILTYAPAPPPIASAGMRLPASSAAPGWPSASARRTWPTEPPALPRRAPAPSSASLVPPRALPPAPAATAQQPLERELAARAAAQRQRLEQLETERRQWLAELEARRTALERRVQQLEAERARWQAEEAARARQPEGQAR